MAKMTELASKDVRKDYYLRTIQISWSTLTPRERKSLFRKYPLIAISLKHLVEEQMIP